VLVAGAGGRGAGDGDAAGGGERKRGGGIGARTPGGVGPADREATLFLYEWRNPSGLGGLSLFTEDCCRSFSCIGVLQDLFLKGKVCFSTLNYHDSFILAFELRNRTSYTSN